MTTTTDSDMQQIKSLISELDKKMSVGFAELDKKIENTYNQLDKKIENTYNQLDKKIDELDKKMSVGFAEVSGKIANTNTQIEGLEKRMGNQEFIYRAVVISILGTAATGLLRLLCVYPFNTN